MFRFVKCGLVLWLAWGSAASAAVVTKKVVRADGARELLANPDFDRARAEEVDGWVPYDAGYTIDVAGGRGGSAAVICDNPEGKLKKGISQTLTLNRTSARPLIISGWSKAENVLGTSNLDYSIYVDLQYQDGSALWGQVAKFSTGTHDWEHQVLRIHPAKPVRLLTVNALFRERTGKVWFDDVSLKELGSEGERLVFDGACLALQQDKEEKSKESGQDAHPPGEIVVRDVAADSDFMAVPTSDGEYEVPELKLSLTVRRETVSPACSRVNVTVKDLAGRDRAVTAYYSVGLDARGWRWFDNVRESRVITPPHEYSNTYRPGVGATGCTSRYPFACVAGADKARSLLVTSPAVCHLGYHAGTRELYAAFDVGLSVDAKSPGSASLTLCDAHTDPAWGMRDTARLFYELLPQYFDHTRVPSRQGNWMAFQAISSVQEPQDFEFAVHEGNNDIRWDNDHGVQPFVYVEPMTFWMQMPKEMPRTYEAAMDHLRSLQNDPAPPQHRIARAVESSCVFDSDGRCHMDILSAPWCDGAVFGNSPDPDVPEKPGWQNLAHHHLSELEAALEKAGAQGGLAGVYLDSLEGWGTLLNYRREHFRAADLPLTFDAATYRPVILNAFATQEWTEFIADWVHGRGKLVMANAVPNEYPFLALPCDLLGTETNWQRDGRFAPPAADYLYIKRTLAWKKPYMFLMNTHFETWTANMTEQYMRLCLFYGMFPGFFSENAATNCYFANPTWYNRDRPLFKKYMPLIRKVAQTGWEPITMARADREEVWLERWGRNSITGSYLTIMNTSDQPQRAKIDLDTGIQATGVARALLAGTEMVGRDGFNIDLPARGVEVIELAPAQP